MQHLTARCKSNGSVSRLVSQVIIAVPDDGAFAGTRVNHDERDLRARACDDFGKLNIDAFVSDGGKAKLTFAVGTEATGVCSLHSEPLQGDHRRRRLSASGLFVLKQARLGVE